MDAFDVQADLDELRLDLPEGMEVFAVTGEPSIAGKAVGEEATVDDAVFNRLLGLDLQNP